VAPAADHRHCKSCGRVCDPDEKTCSPECAQRYETAIRARRNYVYLLVASGLLLLVLLFSHYLV
jgi:predicted nucleic acid-binding Zn ribbon protein